MATTDPKGETVASLRIKLKHPDEKTFIEKFGVHVTRNGVFLPTKSLKPTGTVVRFELVLADGTKIMRGEGVVSWVRAPDLENPAQAVGLGLRFSKLDGETRKLLERIAAHKQQRGLEDTGGVPQGPMAGGESGPVAVINVESGPVPLLTRDELSGGTPLPTPMPELTPAPVFTAPPVLVAVSETPPSPMAMGLSPELKSPGRAPPVDLPALADLVPADNEDLRALLDERTEVLVRILGRARQLAADTIGSGDGDAALAALLAPEDDPALDHDAGAASRFLAELLGAPAPARLGLVTVAAVLTARAATPTPPGSGRGDATPTPPALGPPPVVADAGPALSDPEIDQRPRSTPRRTQPPPPPRKKGATAPPPGRSPDEVTREVDLASIAAVDAAINGDHTRLAAPPLGMEDDATTGVEVGPDPLPAPPEMGPPASLLAATASLDPDDLGGNALDALSRRKGNTAPPPTAGPAEPTSEIVVNLDDEGALLELDPDDEDEEDENLTTGVGTPTPRVEMNPKKKELAAKDDLDAALDAALEIGVEPDDEPASGAGGAAADAGAGAGGGDGDPAGGGDKKRGFFSKIFKK